MQDHLFPDLPGSPPSAPPAPADDAPAPKKSRGGSVQPAPADPALVDLALQLPPQLRFGGSSWNYPGWAGLVWDGEKGLWFGLRASVVEFALKEWGEVFRKLPRVDAVFSR